jgi:hypothetical protein
MWMPKYFTPFVSVHSNFRKGNLDIWKAFFRKNVLSHLSLRSTSVRVAGGGGESACVYDSKAYD